jgi:endo-1,4-beta-xylanase
MKHLLRPFLALNLLLVFGCQPPSGNQSTPPDQVQVPFDSLQEEPPVFVDTVIIPPVEDEIPDQVIVPPVPEVPQEPVKPPVVEQPKPEMPVVKPPVIKPTVKVLKDVVPFPLGAAIKYNQFKKAGYLETVYSHFKSVTPENDLKIKSLQNAKGEFTFKEADVMVNQLLAKGLRVHGHCLVWDAAVNDYFKNFKGTDKEFEAALKLYVQTVVKHFKGRVTSWDVINEPFLDNGKGFKDKTFIKRIPDYHKKVFVWAHEADPSALLFMNDYNLQFTGVKSKAAVAWFKECQKEGIPVHGVGNQMHVSVNLDVAVFKKAIKMFTDLGLLYHISELEVKVFTPNPTPEQLAVQTNIYKGIFSAYQSVVPAKQQFGITTWGVSKPDWFENAAAGKGKWTDDPLLFGDGFSPSEAYKALMSVYNSK